MPRAIRLTPALGAVLFALVGLSACGGLPGNAVVSVDGNSITKDTFNHWMSVAASSSAAAPGSKATVPVPPKYAACVTAAKAAAKPAKGQAPPTEAALKTQCAQQYKTLQQEVLGFLISSNWVIGEAKSLGVKLSDAEVKKQFGKIKSQQFPKAAEFEKFLKTSGQSVSDLLLRVKLNLLSQKIQQKIVKQKSKVTQAQIAKYYKENPKRFGVAEKRNLLIILTKTEAQAKKAKQEVESGKSFESVAKRVSIDPTSKANGGKLPGVVKGQEEKSLDAAVFSAKKNVLTGPVKTPFGYYIFEVQAISAGSQQSLKQAEASIKSQLTATQQQSALSKFVKEFKKKWTSKTDCRSGYVVTDCKQYKAPKTKSTSTPATTTPAAPTTAK
ncbi:MAG: foldase protein PrsA [Solirubrobacteraceae bacterium]|nr:foldase protein PrsA [Solirubrobacteraceae bacterium]MEA2153743.1 foldase protein PrsA [Solirubrobacteraceae bacterium]MEA2225369.1 foldase protein PrsA [Solirubrobacteraceae bacterium]